MGCLKETSIVAGCRSRTSRQAACGTPPGRPRVTEAGLGPYLAGLRRRGGPDDMAARMEYDHDRSRRRSHRPSDRVYPHLSVQRLLERDRTRAVVSRATLDTARADRPDL